MICNAELYDGTSILLTHSRLSSYMLIDLNALKPKMGSLTTFILINSLISGHNASHNGNLLTCFFLNIEQQ
jgi:hypothetical protein